MAMQMQANSQAPSVDAADKAAAQTAAETRGTHRRPVRLRKPEPSHALPRTTVLSAAQPARKADSKRAVYASHHSQQLLRDPLPQQGPPRPRSPRRLQATLTAARGLRKLPRLQPRQQAAHQLLAARSRSHHPASRERWRPAPARRKPLGPARGCRSAAAASRHFAPSSHGHLGPASLPLRLRPWHLLERRCSLAVAPPQANLHARPPRHVLAPA